MNITKYASIVNGLGLVALLLGVFLTVNAVKGNFDEYNSSKEELDYEISQSNEMIQKTRDLKNGVGIEELSPEELAYVQTLTDSTIDMYEVSFQEDIEQRSQQIKSMMWDNIIASIGKEIALIILGISLILVAKSLHGLVNISSKE